MFHDIPKRVLKRMQYLERLDAKHRHEGGSPLERLRQIPPATGKFLALLAASAPKGAVLEVGTSGGYSTLWLALACGEAGRRITTFEIVPQKVRLARETFEQAGVEDIITLVEGDARQYLKDYTGVAFCFLDPDKTYYQDCYDTIIPNMVPGGLLVADNVISHRETLAPMLRHALRDDRVDPLIVPIGSGELICRKI
jgi:caffeoyl-CoA O-methyltransferase